MPLMVGVREFNVNTIVVGGRLRPLTEPAVAELMQSMGQIGILHPIVVARPGGNPAQLVSGAHRLEAAKRLGWETIPCIECLEESSEDQRRLVEIDENLVRADLSPAERAAHQAARKEIYERLHPETVATRRGGPGRAKRTLSQVETESGPAAAFIDDAAKTTGRSRASVAREAKRGTKIPNVAALARTSLDTGEELDALANLAPDRRDALINRAKAGAKVSAKTELKKQHREAREEVLGRRQCALPDKKYGVIVEDYEWDHQTWSENGKDRHASNHYPTSTDAHEAKEIVERTKERFTCAADDCVLFKWATVPHLAIAVEVMRLRGFKYISQYIWRKDKAGTGYWNRNRHEILLIGVRGKIPAPAPGTQWDSVIEAAVGEHSAKPECFLEMIEGYYPNLPKIELNRRGPPRLGWDAWGNEVLSRDNEIEAPSVGDEIKAPTPEDDFPDIPMLLRRTA